MRWRDRVDGWLGRMAGWRRWGRSAVARNSLRLRLVAGFSAAMMAVLVAAGVAVYWRVQHNLDSAINEDLNNATTAIKDQVGDDGTLKIRKVAKTTGMPWQVLDAQGQRLDVGNSPPFRPLASDRLRQLALSSPKGYVVDNMGSLFPSNGPHLRIKVVALDNGRTLAVAVRRGQRDQALRELVFGLILAGLGALVITSIVGGVLARAALRPVERYRSRAAEVAAGMTGVRLDIPEGRQDEVTRLGETLNQMLDSLERALDHERRFVANASHELRTPLTLLKSRIQLARRRRRTTTEYERALDDLGLDVSRLAELADELLALSTANSVDEGQCDAGRVLEVLAADRAVAHPSQQPVMLEVPAEAVWVQCSSHGLERIVTNLVDNAFTHGAPPVEVRLDPVEEEFDDGIEDADWVRLVVEDAGEGMTLDILHEATERFVRAPEARARPGAGLGLSLVEQLVTSAGGELRLCSGGYHTSHGGRAPVECLHGPGTAVTVLLPAADAPPAELRAEAS